MNASIIITTRNRAPFLRDTLQALRTVQTPDGLEAEVLVVDNGSSDETADVVRAARLDHLALRYVCESHPGQCYARNRGLAETDGEMIMFIDDDVRTPPDWLAGMCEPMLQHGPCGVAGGVRLAPHLCRSWMTPVHRSWLAETARFDHAAPIGMVGANMAFSREILRRVPAFDTELGPGALGFGDDQLFASQLLEAGYRIVGRQRVCVEHHFDRRRLLRKFWLEAARKRGRSQAYRGHHWEHWGSRWLRPRLTLATLRLARWRATRDDEASAEGCPEPELELEFQCALLRAHLHERLRPRNYAPRGCVKHHPAAVEPVTSPQTPLAVRP